MSWERKIPTAALNEFVSSAERFLSCSSSKVQAVLLLERMYECVLIYCTYIDVKILSILVCIVRFQEYNCRVLKMNISELVNKFMINNRYT